jgi:peptide/nickel transport system permease protein
MMRSASGAIVVLYILTGIAAPLIAPSAPEFQGDLRTAKLLQPLSSVLVGSGKASFYFFGTDHLARDVFSRLLYGIRLSIIVGGAAMVCSIVLGSIVGFLAGMTGGWIDALLMRATDLFLALPSLFLIIALVAFFGNSTPLLVIVLAATGWMSTARLVRGEVLLLREREFIHAARLLGRSNAEIVRAHMVPNVMPVIVASSVLQLGNVILAEAALSFLGIGIQPPTPSLGNMIGESMAYIGSAWWIGIFPGIALSGLVVAVNLLGDRLQHAFGGRG